MSNIKLDCYADRVRGKRGYIIEKDGVVLKKSLVRANTSENMKDLILMNILDGIKAVKSVVVHEDILTIMVQNRNVAQWLVDKNESKYKDHVYYMDQIFDTIEELDCRYRVVFLVSSRMKKFVQDSENFDHIELESIESILDM